MDDGDTASSWLSDDKRLFIYAIISLALVVGGHRTWQEYHKYHENATRRARVLRLVENSRREKERDAKLSAASAHLSKSLLSESVAALSSSVQVLELPTGAGAGDAAVASSSTTKRSKERRKRGRDTFKDVVKQERRASKMSKQRPQSRKPHLSGAGSGMSTSRPRGGSSSRASSKTRSNTDDESADDTPQPSSSAQFPAFSPNTTERAVETMSHLNVHDDRNIPFDSPTTIAARITLPGSPEPYTLDEPTASTSTRTISSEAPPATATTSFASASLATHPNIFSGSYNADKAIRTDVASLSLINGDIEHTVSSASSIRSHENSSPFSSPSSDRVQLSQPTPFAPPVHKHPSWLGNGVPQVVHPHVKSHLKSLSSSSASSLVMSEASWENGDQTTHAHTNHRRGKSPPPRFRSRSRASASASPAALATSTLNPNQTASTSSAHIASYKGALEAARQREETCQKELKRCREECDLLKWRMNEDTERWRRRESELQIQMQYLMHQLQTLSLASAPSSAHLQYAHTHQHQHQQPLHSPRTLGGFPVMPPVPFGFPGPISSQHSQLAPANGNALHAQLAYPYLPPFPPPAPHMSSRSGSHSSTTASPALDFAPPTYFQGNQTHALNGLNGVNGFNGIAGLHASGSSGDDLDREDFSDELAEAILKRPESIRSPTNTSGSGGSRSASVTGRATRDGSFTFPSLSELGNPQQKKHKPAERVEGSDGMECGGVLPCAENLERMRDGTNITRGGGGFDQALSEGRRSAAGEITDDSNCILESVVAGGDSEGRDIRYDSHATTQSYEDSSDDQHV